MMMKAVILTAGQGIRLLPLTRSRTKGMIPVGNRPILEHIINALRTAGIQEVVMALNPTVEGEATALYLARLLKPLGIRVTRIAHGLPVGGDLEYADEVTIARALEGRRQL